MQLKPEQISRIIRSQIKYYENAIEQTETGTVTMVGDGIARAAGLDNCMAGELVQFESGTYGMAQNLEENSVSIVLLGDDEGIKEGSTIKRTGCCRYVSIASASGLSPTACSKARRYLRTVLRLMPLRRAISRMLNPSRL